MPLMYFGMRTTQPILPTQLTQTILIRLTRN